MKKYIFPIILLFAIFSGSKGQIVNTRSFLSISAGKVVYGGPDHLFFPKGIDNTAISVRADFLYNLLPYLKVGIEGSLVLPGIPQQGDNDFQIIKVNGEKMITAGLNATLFLPYKESGWRNRLRLQFGVAPVLVSHTGERTVTIDNTVWNTSGKVQESSTLILKGPSTGLGLSLTPSMEYYIIQRVGIKLSCNSLLTSFKSDLKTERVIIYSLNFGVFFAISRNKQFNY